MTDIRHIKHLRIYYNPLTGSANCQSDKRYFALSVLFSEGHEMFTKGCDRINCSGTENSSCDYNTATLFNRSSIVFYSRNIE